MAVAEEKSSFILYGSYEEQLDMLTDEQAGKWIKGVYVYMRTGEKYSDDPMVAMLLSVTSHQMDIDARKYAESKERRREAGKKGGRPRKNDTISCDETVGEAVHSLPNDAHDEKPKKAMLFSENQTKDIKPVDVDVNVYEDVDEDVDVDVLDYKTGRSSSRMMKNACAREETMHNSVDNIVDNSEDKIIMPYGRATLPILESEFEQCKVFANGLTRKYMNRSAKEFDMQKVIFYASRVQVSPNDEVYAVFDIDRAELLEYVFDRAAEQERMTWKYIDGIMENYAIRDVHTVREAIKNEADWHCKTPRF